MCKITFRPPMVPQAQDNTKVVVRAPKLDLSEKKEIQHKSNADTKHSVNIDNKLNKKGHDIKPQKLIHEEHDNGHQRGVLYKAKEECIVKATEKTAVKSSEKLLEKVMAKTAVKAGEQVASEVAVTSIVHGISHVPNKAASKFTQASVKVLAKIDSNTVGKAVTKSLAKVGHGAEHLVGHGIEKVAGKSIEKAAAVVATKIGVKGASRLAAMVPVAGVAVSAYITNHDYHDYKAKMADPTVTKTSRVLAGATVGLDALATGAAGIAVATGSTGIGLPVAAVSEGVSWIATGASIVTSGLSEYYKH